MSCTRLQRPALSGGAHVVVTISHYSRATVEYYQGVFQRFGSRGSALTVVPFNQGSKQDVEALVDYIYTTLGLDSLPPRVLIGSIKQATLRSHWLSRCSSPYPLARSTPGLRSTSLAFPSKFHGLHTALSFFPRCVFTFSHDLGTLNLFSPSRSVLHPTSTMITWNGSVPRSRRAREVLMQEDEPRRRQPRSQSATATEALNSTPDTFMEQQHLTLSAYRGHPAGELRPHPMSQEVVSTRHQTSVTACPRYATAEHDAPCDHGTAESRVPTKCSGTCSRCSHRCRPT